MNKVAFLNFLFLTLYKHKSKHIAIFIIATLLIFLLSATLFITSSLQYEAQSALKEESDFIIQKMRAGRESQTPLSWIEKIEKIPGITTITPRIQGRYLLPNDDKYFTIIGLDFFDTQSTESLTKLISNLDIKRFLSHDQMIIGKGVSSYMKAHHFENYFHFYTPDAKEKEISIYADFPANSQLISNDLIILSATNARAILGIDEESASSIALRVPNEAERDTIAFKLKSLFFDARIIDKRDMQSAYENYYNYKSGLFLLLFLLSLSTFMLILYQRYALVGSSDKKEVAILRMLGWSIRDLLTLKLFETLFIGLFAFMLGVVLAYAYVYLFGAPLLRDIFLGFGNLEMAPTFSPVIDGGLLGSLFLFFIFPFLFAVIIPIWRIAITDPDEGMR